MVVTIKGQLEKNVENKVLAQIKKHPKGVTIVDIAVEIGLHRHTVSKYVYGLEKAGQITRRRIGMASLCYPKR